MRARVLLPLATWAGVALILGTLRAGAHEPDPDDRYDHLKCYKVKDLRGLDTATVDLVAHAGPNGTGELPFLVNETCTIKKLKAKSVCVDVQKNGGGQNDGLPNAFDYICYKIKCDPKKVEKGSRAVIRDQFGEGEVEFKKPGELCVPIESKTLSGSTVTTTTTTAMNTTTTMSTQPCGGSSNCSSKTCPPGFECVSFITGCQCFASEEP